MRRGGKWKVERDKHTGMTAQIGPPPTKSITILSILCILSISPGTFTSHQDNYQITLSIKTKLRRIGRNHLLFIFLFMLGHQSKRRLNYVAQSELSNAPEERNTWQKLITHMHAVSCTKCMREKEKLR